MKREKRLTKREIKALRGPRPGAKPAQEAQHIHCIACGRHLDEAELDAKPPTARILTCDHGSHFASCVDCVDRSRALLAEHDRTGQPVKQAGAWH